MNDLQGKFFPRVVLDYEKYLNKNKGGLKNALLSVFVPGLGDYFVEDPAEMRFPPYARTISSMGLIATGLVAQKYRHRALGEWKKGCSETA